MARDTKQETRDKNSALSAVDSTENRLQYRGKARFGWSVKTANWLAATIIGLVPFHAFLTVWGASFGLSYTLLRLWSTVVLVVLAAIVTVWLVKDKELRVWFSQSYLVVVTAVFIVLNLLSGARGVLLGNVSIEAFWFGLLLNVRYLIFFLAIVMLMKYSRWAWQRWVRIVLAAAIIVSAFAVLQYLVLPHDFLTHFGYGAATIEPLETINNNTEYIRIASTLRGPNPLGAYMLVIISLLVALWSWLHRKAVWGIVLGLCTGALIFSFSRSAWLGTALAVACVIIMRLRSRQQWRRVGLISLGMIIITGVIFTSFHNSQLLQNLLYHTDDHSNVALSSNDQRSSALREGAKDVLNNPLGRGVGSAGPASTHNTVAPARLAENYYLQIGQELGWAGLFVYGALSVAVALQLWRQRRDLLTLGVLAAFAGLFVVNMLSHAWTDDTLAFTWWGLAGLVIGVGVWHKQKKIA